MLARGAFSANVYLETRWIAASLTPLPSPRNDKVFPALRLIFLTVHYD